MFLHDRREVQIAVKGFDECGTFRSRDKGEEAEKGLSAWETKLYRHKIY